SPPLAPTANVPSFCRRDAVYDYTLDCSGTGCLSAIELLRWLFDPEWVALRRNGRARTPATVSLKPTRPAQCADGNQNRDPASESARSQSRYLRPTPARMVPPVPEIPIRLRLWSRIAADIDRL